MKKGQAALEFLTTYGWAMLVILVMIGALAYFGVLNPYNLLPDKCIAGAGFSCVESAAFPTGVGGRSGTDNTVYARMTNNLGLDVSQVDFIQTSGSVTGCIPGIWDEGAGTLTGGTMPLWKSNEVIELEWDCTSSEISSGERVKIQFDMSYTPVGKTYQKIVSGEILVKAN